MKKVLFLSFFLTSTNSFAEPIPDPVVEAIQRDTIAWMKKNGWSKKSSRNPYMLLEDGEELSFDLNAKDNCWEVGEETINGLKEKQAADTSRSHVLHTDRSDHEHEISLNLNNLNSNEDEVKQLYEEIESLRENNHALQMWCAERQQELQNAAEENERLKDIIQMKEDLHNTKEQQIENRETEIATLQDKIRILEKNEQKLNTEIEDVTEKQQISKQESMADLQTANANKAELEETISALRNNIAESQENIEKLKDEKECIINMYVEQIENFNNKCHQDNYQDFCDITHDKNGVTEWIERAADRLWLYMKQEQELQQKVLELDDETYDTEATKEIQKMKAAVKQYGAFQEEYKNFAEKMNENAKKRDEALNAALQNNAELNNKLELYKQGFAEAIEECKIYYENMLLEYREQIVYMQQKYESAHLGLESNLEHNNREEMCAELEEENAELTEENAKLKKENAAILELLQEQEEECRYWEEKYNTLIEYVSKIENIDEKITIPQTQKELEKLTNHVRELEEKLKNTKQNQNTDGDTEKGLTKQESALIINNVGDLLANSIKLMNSMKNKDFEEPSETPQSQSSAVVNNAVTLEKTREEIKNLQDKFHETFQTLVQQKSQMELKATKDEKDYKTLGETNQQIKDQNKELQEEQTKNLETIEALEQENERLKAENITQKTQAQEEITQLKKENELLKKTQQELETAKEALLKDKNCVLQKENSIQPKQEEEITQLKKENELLNKQHKEHEAQIDSYRKQLQGNNTGKSGKSLDASIQVIERLTKLSSTTKVSDESVSDLLRELKANIQTAKNHIISEIAAMQNKLNTSKR